MRLLRAAVIAAVLGAAGALTAAGCTEAVVVLGSTGVCVDAPCGALCTATVCLATSPVCAGHHGDGPGPLGQCDSHGGCSLDAVMCPSGPPAPSCKDRHCGEPCDPCAPHDTGCASASPAGYACDAMGACAHAPLCPPPHEPCAGQPCGAACSLCPPGDPMCHDPPGKTCDAMGMCMMGGGCMGPMDAGLDGG